MRILLVGGIARSLINFRGPLIKTLVAKGHDVLACAPDAQTEIRSQLADIGARYFHVPLFRTGTSPLMDFQTLIQLKKIIQQQRPERVLAYTAKPVIYSHIAARMAGKPAVFGMITGLGYGFGKDSFQQRFVGKVVRHLYRIALKSSSGVFFQNPDDKELFLKERLLPKRIPLTILNGSGVDLDWYRPQPVPKEPVFLLVARLLAEKGLHEYYQAARRLKEKYPEARFQVAGDLDANPSSIGIDELERWQAEGVIEYLGRLDDIRPAYAAAKVFVLPSYYREGTPRTALEAMAMGRPLITTDAPGCRETVVDGENGFLVPVKDVERLEKAMEQFILEPELAVQMGANGHAYAVEKYDVHKVNKVIMEAMGLDNEK